MNKYIKTKFIASYILQLWPASFAKNRTVMSPWWRPGVWHSNYSQSVARVHLVQHQPSY